MEHGTSVRGKPRSPFLWCTTSKLSQSWQHLPASIHKYCSIQVQDCLRLGNICLQALTDGWVFYTFSLTPAFDCTFHELVRPLWIDNCCILSLEYGAGRSLWSLCRCRASCSCCFSEIKQDYLKSLWESWNCGSKNHYLQISASWRKACTRIWGHRNGRSRCCGLIVSHLTSCVEGRVVILILI